jgi:hypothetical protein
VASPASAPAIVGTLERFAEYPSGLSVRAKAAPCRSAARRKSARALEACSALSVSIVVAGDSGSSVMRLMIPGLLTTTPSARWSSP